MARRQRSNPLALAVLACLVERPMHPYEISTTLRSRGKELSIKLNYGSLYSVVESLEKHGLIRARETTREGRRPERTVYEITDAGEIECEDWLAELISVPVREFTSLEAGLSLLPLLEPNEAARLLDERAERLRIEQRGIDAAHAEAKSMQLPDLFLIESVFRRTMLDGGVGVRHHTSRATSDPVHSKAPIGGSASTTCVPSVSASKNLRKIRSGIWGRRRARWFNQPQSS